MAKVCMAVPRHNLLDGAKLYGAHPHYWYPEAVREARSEREASMNRSFLKRTSNRIT